MLTARAQGLAALLTMLSLIGCVEKFDYNCVIGLGLIFLGSRHAYLHNLTSFYTMIIATIVVDILSIAMEKGTVPLFPRVILPIIEIIIKIGIIIVLVFKSREQKQMGSNAVHHE